MHATSTRGKKTENRSTPSLSAGAGRLFSFLFFSCHKGVHRVRSITALFAVLGFLFIAAPVQPTQATAPTRKRFEQQHGMVYVWTLKAWKDNALLCEIFRPDEESPVNEDILAYCGETVYDEWASAPPCATFLANGETENCTGGYLTYQGYYNRDYSTYTLLPGIDVSYSTGECEPGNWCNEPPVLTLRAEEPLETYHITQISAQSGDEEPFSCTETDICEYRIPITHQEGVWVDYWAASNFGDESEHHRLHLRNMYRSADGGQYMLDVLSPEVTEDFAALTWDVFPTLAHPDQDLYQTVHYELDLRTYHELYYLAGKLIFTGQVDAHDCVESGLLDNHMANTCGQEAAASVAEEWQNQYDPAIIQAAAQHQMPARIVKAVIAQESQFWPVTGSSIEFGLGSISENGVDVLLAWDLQSYFDVCIPQYGEDACAGGYDSLSAEQQAVLRGLELRAVGSEEEIDLITRVLRANIVQVDQMMENLDAKPLALNISYEELWNFTIANYHTGNTCIANGIETLMESGQELTFENYCTLVTSCPTACIFVERVKGYAEE